MSKSKQTKGLRRGGGFAPALCNVLGILILLAVIASYAPLSIPRFMGYEIYQIVSESMEPEIPVDSVVYVDETEPSQMQEGDIIAFVRDGDVVVHRVLTNEVVMSRLYTKGDANEEQDLEPVDYTSVIGLVVYHLPYVGTLMSVYATMLGKIYALMAALCGALLNILAGRIRSVRRSEAVEKYIRDTMGKDEKL